MIDCMRGHGATTLGVVANIGPPSPDGRDILGFISYGYARQLLKLDRVEEFLLFLYAHRHHCHTAGSWTAGEVSDISGGLPLFCMPAQLTIPLLMRWMLVFEDDDASRLHLGRAIPRAWLGSGREVAIVGASTRWGPVDLSLRADLKARTIRGRVRLPAGVPEVLLRLRAPKGWRLIQAHIDGRPTAPTGPMLDSLRLDSRLGGDVEVTATYAA